MGQEAGNFYRKIWTPGGVANKPAPSIKLAVVKGGAAAMIENKLHLRTMIDKRQGFGDLLGAHAQIEGPIRCAQSLDIFAKQRA